jgi:phage-related protein
MAGRVVSISLVAVDRMSRDMLRAAGSVDQVSSALARVSPAASRAAARPLSQFADRVTTVTAATGRATAALATVASTAASLGPALAPAVVAMAGFAKVSAGAAPALAAFAVAGKFTTFTLTQIFKEGSAATKALQPLKDGLDKAGQAASQAAARGISPLAEAFKRLAMPSIRAAMVDIGKATNQAMKDFLAWGKSAEGLKAVKGIVGPIGTAVRDLGPHVSKVAISFTAMLGRIMGVSLAAGKNGLARVLDLVSAKLDTITAASVQAGLDKLRTAFTTVQGVVSTLAGWVGKLAMAYRTYTTQFRAVADAISVAAIIFGGPVVAAVGAAGLIIRHFDQVSAAYARMKAAFASPVPGGMFSRISAEIPKVRQMITDLGANFRSFGQTVLPPVRTAFDQIWQAIGPRLEDIYRKLTTNLIPAFGGFVQAMGPVVAFLVKKLGPTVAATFGNILRIVGGAIDILAGLFKIATGLLTGDWRKMWSGIRDITRGALNIVRAIISQAWNVIKTAWRMSTGIITAITKRWWSTIRAVFSTALSSVLGRVKAVWGSIRGVFSSSLSAITGNVGRAWSGIRSRTADLASALTGKIKSLMGALKNAFAAGVRGIGSAWDKLREAVKKPVNFTIGVYNRGIISLVNKLADFVGIDSRLGQIPYFARGGTLADPAAARPGMTNGPMAIVGEGRRQYPEYVIPTDPRYRSRASALWASAGQNLMGGREWLTGSQALGGEGIAFASGGTLQALKGGGIIGRFVDGVKNFTLGNVAKAAKGLLGKLFSGGVPGAGIFRDLIAKLPPWIIDKLVGWIKSKVSSGGPGVQRALSFAKAQAGKPYGWGAVGPNSYDCSGLWSAITNVIHGRSPYSRLFSTHSFGASSGPGGYVRGLKSAVQVGVTDAGVGHMAGTLAGHAVESSGSAGVRFDGGARGATNSLFSRVYGMSMDRGGVIPPKSLSLIRNNTGRGELVLTGAQQDILAGRGGDIHLHLDNHGVIGSRLELENWLVRSLDDLRRKRRLPS